MSSNTFSLSLEETFPNGGTKVIALIQLLYGIPSFILMIVFFFVLGCSKNYQNSFYRLVQLDLLTNILCYFNTWFAMRLEKQATGVQLLKLIESVLPGSLNLFKFGINFFLHMQFCSSVALNLHRISSAVFYSSYEKFWSRFYPIYGILSVIYSTSPSFLVTGTSIKVGIINGTLTATYNLDAIDNTIYQTAVLTVIYFVLILGIGLVTAVLVSRTVKTYNNDDRGLSKKLTRIALTYCFLYTGILLWTLVTTLNSLFQFFSVTMILVNSDLMVFASDMMTLALPYILLVYDANVRRDVLTICGRGGDNSGTQVFVSSSSYNQRI